MDKLNIVTISFLIVGIALMFFDIKPGNLPTKEVNLGETFRVNKGQTVKVKDKDVTLTLIKLQHSRGDFVSTPEVNFDLTINGITSNFWDYGADSDPKIPYGVNLIATNFSTRADFTIDKPETKCDEGRSYKTKWDSKDECLLNLAISLKTVNFNPLYICDLMKEKYMKERCQNALEKVQN